MVFIPLVFVRLTQLAMLALTLIKPGWLIRLPQLFLPLPELMLDRSI